MVGWRLITEAPPQNFQDAFVTDGQTVVKATASVFSSVEWIYGLVVVPEGFEPRWWMPVPRPPAVSRSCPVCKREMQ